MDKYYYSNANTIPPEQISSDIPKDMMQMQMYWAKNAQSSRTLKPYQREKSIAVNNPTQNIAAKRIEIYIGIYNMLPDVFTLPDVQWCIDNMPPELNSIARTSMLPLQHRHIVRFFLRRDILRQEGRNTYYKQQSFLRLQEYIRKEAD